jgi:uncharacterized membrane protein
MKRKSFSLTEFVKKHTMTAIILDVIAAIVGMGLGFYGAASWNLYHEFRYATIGYIGGLILTIAVTFPYIMAFLRFMDDE